MPVEVAFTRERDGMEMEEVSVIVPTTRFPMEEEDMYSWTP